MLRYLLALLMLCPLSGMALCPPSGQTRESLLAVKLGGFAMPDEAARNELALALLDCLGDPDPELRDDIAYSALAAWMRAGLFEHASLRQLRVKATMALTEPDPAGFSRPFAALVLAEIARTDRTVPWMRADEREAMVASAAGYLESITDYRGHDDHEGWRHGVAHAADWLMQLAMNPALEKTQLDRILAAIATQAVPQSPHAYVHGEPERLARPVLFVARRGLQTEQEWKTWLATLPSRLGDSALAYRDNVWLARRHDLVFFLEHLHLNASTTTDPAVRALQAPVFDTLQALP